MVSSATVGARIRNAMDEFLQPSTRECQAITLAPEKELAKVSDFPNDQYDKPPEDNRINVYVVRSQTIKAFKSSLLRTNSRQSLLQPWP